MVELFVNIEDPDQMLHSVTSDLGLHCLPVTLLGVSRLQWIKNCLMSGNQCRPDQVLHSAATILSLPYLLRPVCPNT